MCGSGFVRIGLVVLAVASLFCGVLAAPAQAARLRKYVALGDSFAAGPGIPRELNEKCERSSRNYAQVLAEGRLALTDVTCKGATTDALFHRQKAGVAAQLDSLAADTELVTLTVGGNDIGFGGILRTCVFASFLRGCKRIFTANGKDRIEAKIAATAPKIDKALERIRAKAPHAVIVVVGYLRLLPDTANCGKSIAVEPEDIPYLAAKERSLNTMLARRAAAFGALSVDPFEPSTGHDACRSRTTRWTEPMRDPSGAIAMHPNARGMHEVARLIYTALAG
ncbi:lysophospholipase L1-like esterase [Actinocorallia herbida]|uniref:Lysophospholipase L1-like esterase n=1 Tax=Actinocorallia herbida TaxID=58109 RepID=A0A3N1CVI7_9ACTN|nr:SGNH/GDSL hydrolase family protein [Actinocorallia herbida]ROO85319.1 lysophospholipase L1-like esterase [Actinocorallia herbida]